MDTHELGRRPGARWQRSRTVPAPSGLGTDVIGVPAGSDVDLDIRCESVVEGVLVTVTARAQVVGECVRCLDPVVSGEEVVAQELYFYPDQDVVDDEAARLEGDLLDLEPLLRDTVVLALPLQPLCRDGCPGLCPACGTHLADHPGHRHDEADPRWAALGGWGGHDQDDDKEGT